MTGHTKRAAQCNVIAGLALVFSAQMARAQLLDQFLPPDIAGRGIEAGITVLSRQRPDFDPLGVRVGSFIVRPQVTEGAGYESNVLGTRKAQGSAFILNSAGIEANSDVSGATVRAALQVDDTRYLDLPSQSYTNWSASLGGTYDVGRDTISASYKHLTLNETVRDLDVPQLSQPIAFNIDALHLAYKVPINRVFIEPGLDVSNYSYATGRLVGGSIYDQSYRNRVIVTPSVTVGYEFSPRRNALLVLRNSTGSYSTAPPGLPRRDYNDAAVLAGLEYDVTGLVVIRILGGYEMRTFNAALYKTINAPVLEGTVSWTPTGLTTVTGTVERHILDSADESTVAFTETSARLRVDHEYLRNVLLRGAVGVSMGEYSRGGGGRQTLVTAGTGADYQLNRNVRVSADYDFAARTSSSGTLGAGGAVNGFGPFGGVFVGGQQLGSSYVDHRVMLRVRFQL